MDYSPPAPLLMGFPRQEYWRGLPFPSLVKEIHMYSSEGFHNIDLPIQCENRWSVWSEPLRIYGGGLTHANLEPQQESPFREGAWTLFLFTLNSMTWGFPWCPRTLASNIGGCSFEPWRAKMPCASPPKNQNIGNRSNIVTQINKDFMNSSHKKKFLKKRKMNHTAPHLEDWWCKTFKQKHLFAYLRILKFL